MAAIVDVDLYGRQDTSGGPTSYQDDEAIRNAMLLWLSSSRGDFLYRPREGGPLTMLLFKPLISNTEAYEFRLRESIQEAFGSYVQVKAVSITPDRVNYVWRITIATLSLLTGGPLNLQVNTPSQRPRLDQPSATQNISYVGAQLLTWVQTTKPTYPAERLLYNEQTAQWYWGKYVFTELVETDPFFAEILTTINAGL